MEDVKYLSTEAASCFNFNSLISQLKAEIRKKNPKIEKDEFNEEIEKNLKAFSINNQTFEYTNIDTNLGGHRWYVKCPQCKQPCAKLYLPSKHKDRQQKYLCKTCHRLKNSSLLLGNSKKYRQVVKPLKQLERLRTQLLRKSITPERAKPLLDEYERIERELLSSPEYKLWKFQQEHAEKSTPQPLGIN